ncbi:PREDICTED: uncharacterized protein LOC107343173 [Acropora digitifera]|uniref:uncharacterized protein LOC107343173 n=1 Tax=Acropora digitifera TaxID=70779 RepID=UPI00077AFB15|nr:PREDICTED: uncharacterized protein LOC107343173 [Acropora digitifera]
MAGTPSSANDEVDDLFSRFMTEVKEIEKRDSVLTGPQQIDRLTRPGSTYFNLNPYEVGILCDFFSFLFTDHVITSLLLHFLSFFFGVSRNKQLQIVILPKCCDRLAWDTSEKQDSLKSLANQ